MEPRNPAGASPTNLGCTATARSVESSNQVPAFVTRISEELKAHHMDLAKPKTELPEAKVKACGGDMTTARPDKLAMFSGKPGTVEAWYSNMDSYVRLSHPNDKVSNRGHLPRW